MPRIFILIWGCLLVAACTPNCLPPSERNQQPVLTQAGLVASDGTALPTKQWLASKPKAVILALHGYNDYSHAFEPFALQMIMQQMSVIAYDQRGFGQHQTIGQWPGKAHLVADLRDAVLAVTSAYPNTPIYLLGSSMGGAVVIETMHQHPELPIKAMVLNAPAAWDGGRAGPFYKAMLWALANTMPDKTFTGEELEIWATDNMEILKAMSKDPYIVKASRAESIYGLVHLMDSAYQHKESITRHPTLLIYGLKDEVIPPTPIYQMASMLPESDIRIYENGYHMLLRDRQRAKVFDDISNWILENDTH